MAAGLVGLRSSRRCNQNKPPPDNTGSRTTQPETSTSGITHPDCIRLGTTHPDCVSSGTTHPDCVSSGTTHPDCVSSGTTHPDCVSSGTTHPDCVSSGTTHPDCVSSGTTHPDCVSSGTTHPDCVSSGTTHPDCVSSGTTHPDCVSSGTTHPDCVSSGTTHPDCVSSGTTHPDCVSSGTTHPDCVSSGTTHPDCVSSGTTHPDCVSSGTTHPDCVSSGTTRLANWNNQNVCLESTGSRFVLLRSGLPTIEAASTVSEPTGSSTRQNDTPAGENRRQKKNKRRPSSIQEDETQYGNAPGNDTYNNKRKLLRRSSRRSLKQNQPDDNPRCSDSNVTFRGDSGRSDGVPFLIRKRRSAKSFPLSDYQTHCCLVLTSALRETVSCDRIYTIAPKTRTESRKQKTLSQTHFCTCGCSPPVVVECPDLPTEVVTCCSQEDVRDSMATAGTNVDQSFSDLFENESQSDVVLLVGAENAQERIPAHSWVLGNNNDYFRTLLTGPLSDPNVTKFYFNEDQPKDFRSLIRWLYGCGCAPKSTQSALDTLQVAIKYLAVDLVQHVVTHLSKNLDPENVLQIMAWGHQYTRNSELAPSAPPAEEIEPQEDLPPPYPGTAPPPPYETIYGCDPTSSCHLLVSECFSLLDVKADQVLASESLEEVSAPLLSAVLSRDTLGVTSEGPVLDALYRWSSAECRRQHLPLTLKGRRSVLEQMLTLPRLLTINASQLTVLDKLYEQNEINFITSKVKGDSCVPNVPPIFVGILEQMAKKRVPPMEPNIKNKKDKQKNSSKKRFSTKQLMWDIFSVFAHMID